MRQRRGLWVGLLAALLVGCVTAEPRHSTSWLDGLRSAQADGNLIQMQVALVERCVGDHYLNEGLWALADEGRIPLERRGVLEDNGFRIGQVGGITPPELLALLTTERSCANPRHLCHSAGEPKDLVLGPALTSCHFHLQQNGQAEEVALEQAQMLLTVVPEVTSDGHIRLQLTPQVRHGEKQLVPCAAPDHSGYTPQLQQPTNLYSQLSWEVTLAPNEYVVVGARSDKPGSLGYRAFVRPEEEPPVQRVLVIRTGPPGPGLARGTAGEDSLERSPPLALQASWPGGAQTRP